MLWYYPLFCFCYSVKIVQVSVDIIVVEFNSFNSSCLCLFNFCLIWFSYRIVYCFQNFLCNDHTYTYLVHFCIWNQRVSCFSSMQAKSYEFPPYFLTISTAVCLSFYDTHHQNCGIKTNFFNAVGFELKFLKKFPSIKNTLMFSVQYENLIRVN